MFCASIPNTNIPWMDGKLRQQEEFTLWDCASLCLFSENRLSCSDALGKDWRTLDLTARQSPQPQSQGHGSGARQHYQVRLFPFVQSTFGVE